VRPSGRTRARRKRPTVRVRVAQIDALRRNLAQIARPPQGRWNPKSPEDVQRSVAQLVLTLVEFLRQLMERQALRRMEEKTLSPAEIERIGTALMRLEETLRELAKRFGLKPEDLNLDLGAVKLL
jgi:hypothetical protein